MWQWQAWPVPTADLAHQTDEFRTISGKSEYVFKTALQETITRLGISAGVPAKPLVALAELYREARFSRHAMGPEQADKARAALKFILLEMRSTDAPA